MAAKGGKVWGVQTAILTVDVAEGILCERKPNWMIRGPLKYGHP